MNESDYLSIPKYYMKEIPQSVWYSWPIEIRKDFLQMISDPNFFFFNKRPFYQEAYGENIELSEFEKREFWKRVDYFFTNLGITDLESFDKQWGYFAIPFENRTGQILKYYFYLPENKRKVLSILTYYNISKNSNPSTVKVNLLEKEAQYFIVSYVHNFIQSTNRQQYVPSGTIAPPNQGFIPNYGIPNENAICPNLNHGFIPADIKVSNGYAIGQPQQIFPVGYVPSIKNEFNPYINQNQPNYFVNGGQFPPIIQKRGRGRPRKYPVTNQPQFHLPKKRGRKKKSEILEIYDSNYQKEKDDEQISDQTSTTEQNETSIKNSRSESENQEDENNESYSNSESEKSDEKQKKSEEEEIEESESSEELLKKFIASDSSYSYDSDDKSDDDYQETSVSVKNYSLKGKKKAKKPKKQKKLLMSNVNRNYSISYSGYNQFQNGYNTYNSYNNQLFNNRRYPNIAITNVQPQNRPQQQFYKFGQPGQFVTEEMKLGIQPASPFQTVYQMPQQMPPNQFRQVQKIPSQNEIKILPINAVNKRPLNIFQNPQSLMNSQTLQTKMAINNFFNPTVNQNSNSTHFQPEKSHKTISITISTEPFQQKSASYSQNTTKVKKYLMKKIDKKPSEIKENQEEIVNKTNNISIADNQPTNISNNAIPYLAPRLHEQQQLQQQLSMPIEKQQESDYDYEEDISNEKVSNDAVSTESTFNSQSQSAQFQSDKNSTSESEMQNEDADSEMDAYYDEEYESNENEASSNESPQIKLRNRRGLHKINQRSDDDEPTELIGIISELSYIYDESNISNDTSRIAKMKPSSLIDLEFKLK